MNDLIEFLEGNGVIIENNTDNIINILYKFDLVEINVATSYANELEDISDEERENEKKEYLRDIAEDNISEIVEEAMEEFEISIKYDICENTIDTQKFTVILE